MGALSAGQVAVMKFLPILNNSVAGLAFPSFTLYCECIDSASVISDWHSMLNLQCTYGLQCTYQGLLNPKP